MGSPNQWVPSTERIGDTCFNWQVQNIELQGGAFPTVCQRICLSSCVVPQVWISISWKQRPISPRTISWAMTQENHFSLTGKHWVALHAPACEHGHKKKTWTHTSGEREGNEGRTQRHRCRTWTERFRQSHSEKEKVIANENNQSDCSCAGLKILVNCKICLTGRGASPLVPMEGKNKILSLCFWAVCNSTCLIRLTYMIRILPETVHFCNWNFSCF